MENSSVTIKDKFRNGCVFIFKSWSAFRIALDKNPQILTFYNQDNTTIEINEMLNTLYEEVFSIFSQFQDYKLKEEIADRLYGFIQDYFQIFLEDQSEIKVASKLIELYDDVMNGNDNVLNQVKASSKNIKNYEVTFPIEGNQKVIFERDSEDEDEVSEEDNRSNNNGENKEKEEEDETDNNEEENDNNKDMNQNKQQRV